MVEVANQSYDKAHYLANKLQTIEGVELNSAPFWCEFPLTFTSPEVLEKRAKALSKRSLVEYVSTL